MLGRLVQEQNMLASDTHRLRYDIAPAVLAFLLAIPTLFIDPEREQFEVLATPSATTLALAFVGCAALVVRRRFPIPVLVVVAVLRTVMAAGIVHEFALLPAALVALFTVARTGPRGRALAVAMGVGAAMAVGVALADTDESFVPELFGELAIVFLPIAIADAVRSRADRLRDLIDSEAAARVQAERLRIARDLHDVVAHGLSVITVQSGVAAHLLDREPQQAKKALEVINTAGKQSLEELRAMVGVLRSTDEVPLMPTPTDPDDLSSIIDGARRGVTGSGVELVVSVEVDGAFPGGVSEASVIAVHRIVAEALANVARHGRGAAAEVVLTHRTDDVVVEVTNDLRDAASSASSVTPGAADVVKAIDAADVSTGVGIIGMTERAESLGGSLLAESTADGHFQVTATVPYHHAADVAAGVHPDDRGHT